MAPPLAGLMWATMGLTAVGTGLSAWGSHQAAQAAQGNANDQAEAAAEMYEYNWGERKNQESYAQYNVDINRIQEENLRNFTDTMNLDKYNRELFIRDYNHKSQVEEYNKTELQYAQQIDYNAMSATLARDEQLLWLDEQLKQAAFDTEGLILDTEKKYQDIGFQRQEAGIKLRHSQDVFGSTREDISLKQRSKRAEFAEKAMEGWHKKLQDEGKVRALGQAGRTGRKNRQSVLAMAGQRQAMLNSMVTRSDLSFALEHQKNQQQYATSRRQDVLQRSILSADEAYTGKMFGFGQRKIQASTDSALAQNKANLLRIEHQNYGADMAADNQRLTPPPAYEDLPPITAPYYSPETHIADAYKTEKKPPGPAGAPNLMAGAGLQMAGQIASGIAKAGAGMYEAGAFDNLGSSSSNSGSTGSDAGYTYGEGGHSFSGDYYDAGSLSGYPT